MNFMANPLFRVGLGAGAGFLASIFVPKVPYLGSYGKSVGLAGAGALAAYLYGRKYEDTAIQMSPPLFAMKAPTAGEVIALAGQTPDYETVMCSTTQSEKMLHQPMRALGLVAGTLGVFASLKAYRERPDFKLEGIVMALGAGAIAAYNGYGLVRSYGQMNSRFLPQLQPVA